MSEDEIFDWKKNWTFPRLTWQYRVVIQRELQYSLKKS